MKQLLCVVCASAVFLAVPVRAEIQLQKVQWQLSRKAKGQALHFEEVQALSLEGARLPGRLRAQLTVLNRGPRAVEGILLRYSVSARLAPKEKSSEAVWAVPFMLEERRVPKVGPNKVQEIPLDPHMLAAHLLKVDRAGYTAEEIKLQVMLVPRIGETSPLQILESSLRLKP